MHRSLLPLLILTACDGSDTADTDRDSNAEDTAFGWVLRTAEVDGSDAATHEALTTDTIAYALEGDWWNSADCPECGAAAVVLMGDVLNTCTELDSAGPLPGSAFSINTSAGVINTAGDVALSLVIVEDVSCDELATNPDLVVARSEDAFATLTVMLDDSLVVETTFPARGARNVAPDTVVIVNTNDPIDVNASSGAEITLSRGATAVSTTVTLNDRRVQITPTEDLPAGRNSYMVVVDGLVSTSGAVMAGPDTWTFQTPLFETGASYELVTSASAAQPPRLSLQPQSDSSYGEYEVVRLEPNFADYPPQIWNFEPVGTLGGYIMRNAWVGDAEALGADGRTIAPTMRSLASSSPNQIWYFDGNDSTGYRMSVEVYGTGDVLEHNGSTESGRPRLQGIGSSPNQRWFIVPFTAGGR